MADQVGLLGEPLVAVLAQEGFLSSVHQHVLVQLALGGKRLAALVAPVVLLARVDLGVRIEIAGTGEPFGAIRAPVGPLWRVNGDRVFRQLLSCREGFRAGGTNVVLLPRVSPHVGVQVAPVDEPLVAQVAHVGPLPSVDSYVVYQTRLGAENFAARVALVLLHRFFRRFRAALIDTDQRQVFHLQVEFWRFQIPEFDFQLGQRVFVEVVQTRRGLDVDVLQRLQLRLFHLIALRGQVVGFLQVVAVGDGHLFQMIGVRIFGKSNRRIVVFFYFNEAGEVGGRG